MDQLVEMMQLNKLSKEQLIELCNSLYGLLQQRPQPNYVFVPNVPAPILPPTFTYWPYGPTIMCGTTSTEGMVNSMKVQSYQ